jgi:2-succinyl-6-hydroxy-2,4-cyclohexadiene-1-carboxylate synthase
MNLACESIGEGQDIAFVHGFTQTSQSWKPLVSRFRTPLHSQLIDAPGHGLSSDGQRNLWESGQDIIDTMNTGVLVGYSMGARMCLHAALLGSTKIESLILLSGTAGIRDSSERLQRQIADNHLADHIHEIGVPAFLEEWLKKPMFAGLHHDQSDFVDRCRNTQDGLSHSLRNAGVGTQEPLWERLVEIHVPVLLIAGDRDQKFVHLAQEMHELIPQSTLCIISEAGHSVHLENPASVAHEIDTWLLDTYKKS